MPAGPPAAQPARVARRASVVTGLAPSQEARQAGTREAAEAPRFGAQTSQRNDAIVRSRHAPIARALVSRPKDPADAVMGAEAESRAASSERSPNGAGDGPSADPYDRLSPFRSFSNFARATDPDCYTALPKHWVLGLTDVVRSTDAIAGGRYKAVNVAGAAAISALMNALGTAHFPFAFAGDGCAFALPPEDAAMARGVLASTASWVRDDLRLTLRAALVPVADIRAAGREVSVALYKPSPHVAYAMFDGGGVAWAEARMKSGAELIAPGGPGERPDLSGLSCRWMPIRARNGAMVSIIARPVPGREADFRRAAGELIALLGDPSSHHPVPRRGPHMAPLAPALRLEALASRGALPLWRRLPKVIAHHLMGWLLFATRIRVGGFDPPAYRALTSGNADARKFGDGLMLTADCSGPMEARVREFLAARAAEGVLRYGMHRQSAALMTCVVPSYVDDGHFHFIDGADGGYAVAAGRLKG